MTIKQNGGIFGRNPTFNDVTVEGDLSTSGAFNPSGDVTLGGDFFMSSATPNIKITDTDLAHGMTTLTETDTLLTQAPETASSGGVRWSAYSAAAIAMQFLGTSTTPSTDGNGAVFRFRAAKKSGTTETSLADGEDIVTFGNTGTEVVTIKGNGNIVLANGAGIDFSATSDASGSTSELFDDYEEGTWTPSLGGDTTYTVQEGYYVKVGSLVNVKATILVNAIGTGSVNTISGLPYTNGGGIAACNVAYWGTIATAVNHLVGTITADGTTITMRGVTTAASSVSTITTFQNSAYVELTATYSTLT